MISTLLNSFYINITYGTNILIHNLKKLPIIKKIIPSTLYGSKGFKILCSIFYILYKISSTFVGKIVYIGLFIGLYFNVSKSPETFCTIFIFLSIIGSIIANNMVNPTKEKFQAVILMKMNAKKYALARFCLYIATIFVSFIPSMLIFGLIYKVKIIIIIILIFILVMLKIIGSAVVLYYYEKKNKLLPNSLIIIIPFILVCLLAAYALPLVGYGLSKDFIMLIFIFLFIVSPFAIIYLFKTNIYNKLYKKTVTMNAIVFDVDETNKKSIEKQIKMDINLNDELIKNKSGYEYFNAIFVGRHKKILTDSAKKETFAILFIIIFLSIISIYVIDIKVEINKFLLLSLPYFVFIMYILNRGTTITQAMFFNCDHSMLSYRFFRKPTVILNLFKIRLRTIIRINIIPAIVLAGGLPILLLITGGTNNIFNYFGLFVSIIFMSIFFSVHHLILYYLLQPYDINMKTKNYMYSILSTITYMFCYFCMQVKIDTFIFSIFTIIFSLIYIAASIFVIYRYASKTFKLR